jgi:hypothetical protein
MKLSSDLKLLADLARSLADVHALLSIKRDDAALVEHVLIIRDNYTDVVDDFQAMLNAMEFYLANPAFSRLVRKGSSAGSAVEGQEDWVSDTVLREGLTALWIHSGSCSVESIAPKIFPVSLWGDLE